MATADTCVALLAPSSRAGEPSLVVLQPGLGLQHRDGLLGAAALQRCQAGEKVKLQSARQGGQALSCKSS